VNCQLDSSYLQFRGVTLRCTQTCTTPCLHWSCWLGSLHAKLVDEPCLPGRDAVPSKFVTVDVTNKDEEEQEEVIFTACKIMTFPSVGK